MPTRILEIFSDFNCAWCYFDHEICNQDGICADVCPRKLIDFSTKKPTPVAAIETLCIRCGHCMAVCPTAAISVAGINPLDCELIDKKRYSTAVQLGHLLKSRRSFRVYQDRPVKRETILQILDVCRYPPQAATPSR